MNVIPAIDLRRGRCVRLHQGDFAAETVYGDDPAAVAERYRDSGFTELHVVDLDGARDGRRRQSALVRRIVGCRGLEVQCGGGLRSRDAIARALRSGVKRCVIGSMAVTEPDAVAAWAAEFGGESFVLAFDVRIGRGGEPRLAIHGWTESRETTLWDAMDRFRSVGVRHVLCTDVSRDGTARGPNVTLYRELTARYPATLVQASGGVRNLADLAALRDAGCAAAISGRALLDSTLDSAEVCAFRRGA